VHADPAACSVQFDPIGVQRFDGRDCDIAKAYLTRQGISYTSVDLPAGSPAEIRVGASVLPAPDPRGLDAATREARIKAFGDETRAALSASGYPEKADPAQINRPMVVAIVAFLSMLAASTYAPIAAFLVELFPARIRYTSLSFPYHLGSGWVGGLLPATAFAIVATTGNIYAGLWYPVLFASVSTVVGILLLPETRGREIEA